MQNTAFEVEEKQPNTIFATQFYKLELGVIANIESCENGFEYENGLKSFSYLWIRGSKYFLKWKFPVLVHQVRSVQPEY